MMTRRQFAAAAALAPVLASGRGQAGAAPRSGTTAFRRRVHPLEGVARQKLKITDVRVTLMSYELPPEKQWMVARAVTWKTDAVLVEVFTDKGIVGIGESSPYGGPPQMKKMIEEWIRPTLLGKNPFDVEQLTPGWSAQRGRPGAATWAGIDMALWDIIGKATNTPVYRLLATDAPPERRIRVYASGGVSYAWYKRPEDLIDEAVRHKEAGYTAFKFRIGTEWRNSGMTIQKYIPYLRKLRQAVGPDFDLMQESNMRLTLEQCLELCPVLEELKFLWFEEPVSTSGEGALEAYIKINQALPTVLVAGGESRTNRFEFKEWIDRGAYDIVQPDCNVTGVTEAWHIARIAALSGKPCCPHNWHGGLTTMANAALVAAIPNRMMLELNQTYNPFKEEIFKDPLVVKKGYMELFDRPGFGVELIPGIAKKFPYIEGRYDRPNPDLPPTP
jgi:L-alanine-DL-glutamate epimerase-like enolase superfamily enzyme